MARYSDYITEDGAKVLAALGSGPHGLSAEEARRRLHSYGANIVEYEPPDWRRILLRQFESFFVYLLLAAALINFSAGDKLDAAIIASFIFIFVAAGFYQEYRAERTIYRLRKFLRRYAMVRRDGEIHRVDIQDLVPGDIVLLRVGDMIPADVRILRARRLSVDESLLTGESVPVPKDGSPLARKYAIDALRAPNIGLFGSTVVEGWAQAVVLATGKHVYFAEMFERLNAIDRPSLFEKRIKNVAKALSNLILVFAVIAFAAKTILTGRADADFLVFMVALIVAVVPEALPLVVTLAFSRESLALAKRKVVIKRLTAIEDLGDIEILCTDKTGTITKNELTLTGWFGPDERTVIEMAALGFSRERFRGVIYDPFDNAIAEQLSDDTLRRLREREIVESAAFDPIRRINSVISQDGERFILVSRGAPESILERSSWYRAENGTAKPLDDSYRARALAWFRERGRTGERVLGIAYKELRAGTVDIAEEEKRGMTVAGFLAFADPLKETSKPAFDMLGRMGITLKIITGDSREVAGAVGYRLGLIGDPSEVITGDEFSALSPDEKIEAAARHNVFARTLPMHKYEIIAALRQRYSVGFLGEGFNDVPALKSADLALAVENASDMTRNVSDIILLERDLMVIAQGVARGRKIFANVLKYIRTTLAANIGNFFSVTFASMLLPFLPMLPIQILLVNLLSDLPMVSISLDNVAEAEIAKPRNRNMRDLFLFVAMFGAVSSLFDFIFFGTFLRFGAQALQTGWFFFSVVTEVLVFLSLRSLLPIRKAGLPSRAIVVMSVLAVSASAGVIYFPAAAATFQFLPLGYDQIFAIAVILMCYLAANEIMKRIYVRFVYPLAPHATDRADGRTREQPVR